MGKRRAAKAFLVGSSAALVAALAIGAAPAAGPVETLALGRVTVDRSGDGSVASENSTVIQCGSTCEAQLPIGSKLALLATATPKKSVFHGWTGACTGLAPRCEIVVGTKTSVGATFATGDPVPKPNLLNVSVGGMGSVQGDLPGLIDCPSVRCRAGLSKGVMTLRATPQSGWTFVRWSGNRCSGTGSCVIDFSKPAEVQATFRRIGVPDGTSTLTITDPGQLGGNITYGPSGSSSTKVCPSTCKGDFANRSLVTLEADGGVFFSGWGPGSCRGISATCVVAISGDETVKGRWSAPANSNGAVNVTRSGKGRVWSSPPGISCGAECSAGFLRGQSVTLNAEPATNYELDHWGGLGANCAGVKCPVPAAEGGAPVSVVFVVAKDPLTVQKSGDGGGRVTSNPAGIDCGTRCSNEFNRGTQVTLTADPDATSRFAGWTPCSGGGRCTVTIGKTPTVTAAFERLKDKVSVKKEGDGEGTVTSRPAGISCGQVCFAAFPRGTTVELQAAPAAGSRFAGWSAPCGQTGACPVQVTEPKSVRARFELIRDELRVDKTGTGAGSVTSSPGGISCGDRCTARFKRGKQVVLRATATAGSRFAGWRGACGTAPECRVTMQGDARVEAHFDRICAAATATGFTAKVVKGPRRALVTVRLEWRADARLSLFRGNRKLAGKAVPGLGKGLRTLRLDVPRGTKAGRARIVLGLSDSCGRTKTFTKAVTVPRK